MSVTETLTAPINKIIDLSTVDGSGARTSVFFQKCNIACVYCHNPETINMCCHCGICIKSCPADALTMVNKKVVWNENKCIQCDMCIKVCPYNASPKIVYMTPEDVLKRIMKNRPFIRGITVSGGECTLHADFLLRLFQLAQAEGLTCLMDSNGTIDLSNYPELMSVTNGVMLDVKAWTDEAFSKVTHSQLGNIVKKNLVFLAEHDLLEELRIVYVPDYVDIENVIYGTAEFLGKYTSATSLKLISFRNFGVKGELATAVAPKKTEMIHYREIAEKVGFKKIVVL